MVKIAVDCRMINKSGIGVYLKNILQYWIKTTDYSWMLIGDVKELNELELTANCKVIQCNLPIFTLKELIKFPVNEVNKCDLFYSPNFNLPFGINIPIYITIHDVVFLDYKDFSSKLGYLTRYFFLRRAIRLCKKIFTVSEFSKQRINFHFGNKREIIVAYNGIRNDLLTFRVTKSPRIYDFEYLLFIGNIKKHKGLDILLSAINGTDKKLVVVGDITDLKTSDEITYEKMSLNNNIILAGRIQDDEKLYTLIAQAEVLIQPSRYEGFGIPPLEALYLNTPVILSDIDVFKEIYGTLPIIFFKDGDSNDLSSKIIEKKYRYDQKYIIEERYNFELTAKIILSKFN